MGIDWKNETDRLNAMGIDITKLSKSVRGDVSYAGEKGKLSFINDTIEQTMDENTVEFMRSNMNELNDIVDNNGHTIYFLNK